MSESWTVGIPVEDNEFGPVDLTGLEPDKLPRLIDMPGVKELVEAAYRAGYQQALDLTNLPLSAHLDVRDQEENYIYEYMKVLEGKDE